MGCISTDDWRYQYLEETMGISFEGSILVEEDQGLKACAKKIGLHPVAQWKPLGIEMAGLNSGETVVPGYTSEGSVGLEAGDKVKIGFDFYGRVAVNGQNKFAMSGGPRFNMSIDKYYGAFLAGSRVDGTFNPDDVLPESSANFSLEGGAELGRRSDGLIPSFTVGALWRADDQKLASTYLLLGYDW